MYYQGNCELSKAFPCISPCRSYLNIEAFGVKMIEYIVVNEILHDHPHEAHLNDECKCCTDNDKSHNRRELFLFLSF